MSENFPNANEANIKSLIRNKVILRRNITRQIQKIENKILEAISHGRYTIIVREDLFSEVKEHFSNLGYEIIEHSFTTRVDGEDVSFTQYTNISWRGDEEDE